MPVSLTTSCKDHEISGVDNMCEFLLESLKINHHGKEIMNVQFVAQSNTPRDKIFTTLILGVNGSGKSYLLTIIANIFIFLEKAKNYQRKPKFRYDQFSIGYEINGYKYEVKRLSGSEIYCYRDSLLINLEELALPCKILAVSFLVNDKFLFTTPEMGKFFPSYIYLGVRKSSNATYTSSILQNVMRNFFEVTLSENYTELITILSLMKFDKKVQFKVINNNTSKSIDGSKNILKDAIWDSNISIDFQNDRDENRLYLNENKESILSCIKSDELELSNIIFFKNGERIPFEDCSSGEKHLIFSLTGILNNIKPNSLVLIDEPEISLHPEWQTKYIDLIKKIFHRYGSCHFLIASHSHYLVSDLEPHTSSIVFMNRAIDTTSPSAELLPYSTYAWSAENVIYNIFGVRTTRNYYFEADLRKIIDLMNSDDGTGSNVDEIQNLVNKLRKFIFDQSDPLNIVLDQAQEFCDVYKKNI